MDAVRRAEHRQLLKAGDNQTTGSRYVWLGNARGMSRAQWRDFGALQMSNLKVARAWAIKEMAMSLWGYARRGRAERIWRKWHAWAVRSRPPAIAMGRQQTEVATNHRNVFLISDFPPRLHQACYQLTTSGATGAGPLSQSHK
ncbi:MAG: transposase [Gammaproteobacteria bacterium]|nr:transposase [Gammaproteobacteria bacterium]